MIQANHWAWPNADGSSMSQFRPYIATAYYLHYAVAGFKRTPEMLGMYMMDDMGNCFKSNHPAYCYDNAERNYYAYY